MKFVKDYPDDFRAKVVQHYLESGDSYRLTAVKFALPNTALVTYWVRKAKSDSPLESKITKYNPGYSEGFKSEVVRHYIESKDTASAVSKKYKISPNSVAIWVAEYSENAEEIRKSKATKYQNTYSDSFKAEVVRHYLTTEDGYSKTAKKFDLPSVKSVSNWVLKFGGSIPALTLKTTVTDIHESTIVIDNPVVIATSPSLVTSDHDQLKRHIQQLEFRLLAANTMIDVAEREYNISIRKKSGAKQSRK